MFHTTLHLGLGLIPATHRSVVSHTTNLEGVGEKLCDTQAIAGLHPLRLSFSP